MCLYYWCCIHYIMYVYILFREGTMNESCSADYLLRQEILLLSLLVCIFLLFYAYSWKKNAAYTCTVFTLLLLWIIFVSWVHPYLFDLLLPLLLETYEIYRWYLSFNGIHVIRKYKECVKSKKCKIKQWSSTNKANPCAAAFYTILAWTAAAGSHFYSLWNSTAFSVAWSLEKECVSCIPCNMYHCYEVVWVIK